MSDDIHALSGAYAVDALDDIERAQFERHLAQCPACQHEVASLREASALLAETTAVQPSGQLRDRVLAGITTVRPLPPVIAEATAGPAIGPATGSSLPRRRRRAATFLAAAAAVVAIGAGGVVWHSAGNDGHHRESVADTVIGAPDHEKYSQELGNGASATIYRSKKVDGAVLVTKGMPAAPSGHEYVVWLLNGDTMLPAAVMPTGADNTVVLSGDAAGADGVGITVEQDGPAPTTPSSDVVTTVRFRNA
jgi:Anti-sigma-K factor rskA/Putative zinc-finger